MRYATMRRSLALCAALLACGLAACGGGDDKGAEPDGAIAPSGTSAEGVNSTGATLRVQLTGLLLMVPRSPGGRTTEVLLPLPTDPRHPHIAVIGFGYKRDTDLCSSYRAGICYVNLDEWFLEPIGAGAERSGSNVQLPAGVLNLTRGSGGAYKVNFQDIDTVIRTNITLLEGNVAGKPCSLGEWRYVHVDSAKVDTMPMVNVLNWDIQHPQGKSVEFVFRDKQNFRRVKRVPLSPDASNEIHVIVAHIPESEEDQLPPGRPVLGQRPATDSPSPHFHHFYDLFRAGNKRPVPRFVRATADSACPVKITGMINEKIVDRPPSLGTYSCVMAAGEEGP